MTRGQQKNKEISKDTLEEVATCKPHCYRSLIYLWNHKRGIKNVGFNQKGWYVVKQLGFLGRNMMCLWMVK